MGEAPRQAFPLISNRTRLFAYIHSYLSLSISYYTYDLHVAHRNLWWTILPLPFNFKGGGGSLKREDLANSWPTHLSPTVYSQSYQWHIFCLGFHCSWSPTLLYHHRCTHNSQSGPEWRLLTVPEDAHTAGHQSG